MSSGGGCSGEDLKDPLEMGTGKEGKLQEIVCYRVEGQSAGLERDLKENGVW